MWTESDSSPIKAPSGTTARTLIKPRKTTKLWSKCKSSNLHRNGGFLKKLDITSWHTLMKLNSFTVTTKRRIPVAEAQTSAQNAWLKALLFGLVEPSGQWAFSLQWGRDNEKITSKKQILKQSKCSTYSVTTVSYLTAGGGVERTSSMDFKLESWHLERHIWW